ncbi:MAG: carbon-nitrogen hydrolase family protein [Candidatus Bathyarchaeota archaeon]
MGKFKVAIAQVDCILDDKKANMNKASNLIKKASKNDVEIIIFPEVFLSGYALHERLPKLAERFNDKSEAEISLLAKENKIMIIMGFLEINTQDKVFNSLLLMNKSGNLGECYRKTHLWPNELNYFEPGKELTVIPTEIGTLGLMISYDLYFPEVARALSLKGAKILFVSAADWMPHESYVRAFVRSRALENQAFLVYSNRVGKQENMNLNFFGESCIVDPKGNVITKAGRGEELMFGEIDLSTVEKVRAEVDFFKDRQPKLYTGQRL